MATTSAAVSPSGELVSVFPEPHETDEVVRVLVFHANGSLKATLTHRPSAPLAQVAKDHIKNHVARLVFVTENLLVLTTSFLMDLVAWDLSRQEDHDRGLAFAIHDMRVLDVATTKEASEKDPSKEDRILWVLACTDDEREKQYVYRYTKERLLKRLKADQEAQVVPADKISSSNAYLAVTDGTVTVQSKTGLHVMDVSGQHEKKKASNKKKKQPPTEKQETGTFEHDHSHDELMQILGKVVAAREAVRQDMAMIDALTTADSSTVEAEATSLVPRGVPFRPLRNLFRPLSLIKRRSTARALMQSSKVNPIEPKHPSVQEQPTMPSIGTIQEESTQEVRSNSQLTGMETESTGLGCEHAPQQQSREETETQDKDETLEQSNVAMVATPPSPTPFSALATSSTKSGSDPFSAMSNVSSTRRVEVVVSKDCIEVGSKEMPLVEEKPAAEVPRSVFVSLFSGNRKLPMPAPSGRPPKPPPKTPAATEPEDVATPATVLKSNVNHTFVLTKSRDGSIEVEERPSPKHGEADAAGPPEPPVRSWISNKLSNMSRRSDKGKSHDENKTAGTVDPVASSASSETPLKLETDRALIEALQSSVDLDPFSPTSQTDQAQIVLPQQYRARPPHFPDGTISVSSSQARRSLTTAPPHPLVKMLVKLSMDAMHCQLTQSTTNSVAELSSPGTTLPTPQSMFSSQAPTFTKESVVGVEARDAETVADMSHIIHIPKSTSHSSDRPKGYFKETLETLLDEGKTGEDDENPHAPVNEEQLEAETDGQQKQENKSIEIPVKEVITGKPPSEEDATKSPVVAQPQSNENPFKEVTTKVNQKESKKPGKARRIATPLGEFLKGTRKQGKNPRPVVETVTSHQ